MRKQTAKWTILAAAILLPTSAGQAQRPVKRKPLTLGLFLHPFKPRTVTPQVFGLLPENAYLQKEIKLTASQKQRMRQIERQLTRVSTVLRENDVQKELGISKSQLQRIEKRRSAARKKFETLSVELAKLKKNKKRPTRKELAALRKKGDEIEAEFDKAALNELTRRQRDKFRKLTGKAIDPTKIFNRNNLLHISLAGQRFSRFSPRPFKPQTTTPKIFGIASDIEYLALELKLTAAQRRRIREIEIQLTQPSSILMEKGVRKELAITKQQDQRVQELRSQRFAKLRKTQRISPAKLRELEDYYDVCSSHVPTSSWCSERRRGGR